MSISLVILAAGAGSRFGGAKHLAEVGPQGQCLFQYSVQDACAAGFDHIVVVVGVGEDTSEISKRCEAVCPGVSIDFIEQRLSSAIESDEYDELLAEREKPWGTAHALLCCAGVLRNPFVVINADDYYGASNFAKLGDYLLGQQSKSGHADEDVSQAAIPGFLLSNTLSANGGVNRGVLSVDNDGFLTSVYEAMNIRLGADSRVEAELPETGETLKPPSTDSLVSMNMWGFPESIFAALHQGFSRFLSYQLSSGRTSSGDEYVIPLVVDEAIAAGKLRVKVLPTSEQWQGVTFKEDLQAVRNHMQKLSTGRL